MNFSQAFMAMWSLAFRELIRFFRQRSRLIGAFLTPVLFWCLLGFGIDGSSTSDAGVGGAANFKQYFVPGMMVMAVVFTAIYSAISLIEDRNSGFFQGVIVSPLPRWSWVASKILGASLISIFQGLLLLPLAFATGLHPGITEVFAILLLFLLIAVFISSLALHFGWRIESVAGFHGIMNTVLMPLWFLSGSTFPIKTGPLSWIAKLNPLTYAVTSFQEILFHDSFAGFSVALLVVGAFSFVLFTLSLMRAE